jgi:Ca-activated chloride channel family protein
MWWAEPLWLLCLVAILPIWWMGSRQTPSINPFLSKGKTHKISSLIRVQWLMALRITAIVAIVLAIAGTKINWPAKGRCITVALDISASIPDQQLEKARTSILRLINDLSPSDRVAIVLFAGEAQILTPLSLPGEAAAVLEVADFKINGREETDLEAGLVLAARLLSTFHGDRCILLYTDGRPTAGAGEVEALTKLVDIPIHITPLGEINAGILTNALYLPEGLRAGEKGLARWKVWSDRARQVRARLSINQICLNEQLVQVEEGANTLYLSLSAGEPGVYPVNLEVLNEDDQPVVSAAGGGVLKVHGQARILVVSERRYSPIALALSAQGMNSALIKPEAFPVTPGGLFPYSAVVFDNVSADKLVTAQIEELEEYVAGGGGLLVVGGDSSLGRGGYYGTRLEAMLPVWTDTRQRLRFSKANILFIIDGSGSMSETVGETPKQLAAMKGVLASIEELSPRDEVAILSFSDHPVWVLPFTPVSARDKFRDAMMEMEHGGGTEFTVALEEAIRVFSGRGPVRRHVVLISDGITDIEELEELSRQLKNMGVTISTIAVGDEINEPLLRSIARWGEGGYYRAELDQIPRVMMKETIRVTREQIQEGVFHPVVQTHVPSIQGIAFEQLPVLGYIVTRPKKMATINLTIGKGDPLLASWRYGEGKVTVFTSDSGGRWLAGWSRRSDYNRMWSQLVRSILRSNSDEGLRVAVRAEGGDARIVIDAIGMDRRLRSGLSLVGRVRGQSGATFSLDEVIPGRYEASIPLSGAGFTWFEVTELPDGVWTADGIWALSGREYGSMGPDMNFLGYLSGSVGGEILSLNNSKPLPSKWSWRLVDVKRFLIILALLLFLVELAVRSTSLGQLAMACIALSEWWSSKIKGMEEIYGSNASTILSGVEEHRHVNSARRYLAQQAKQKKEKDTQSGI